MLNLFDLAEKFLIKNTLVKRKNHKKQLIDLQELLNNSRLLIDLLIDRVNSIINKYQQCNSEAKKILNRLSTSFIENHKMPQFFSKSMTKKMQRQNGKLSDDYVLLKEQSNWLEKLIKLIKCDTDDRVIKLYAIVVEADDYQKTYDLLNEKINLLKKTSNKKVNNLKQNFSTFTIGKNTHDDNINVNLPHSDQLIEMTKLEAAENFSDTQVEKIVPTIFKSQSTDNEDEQRDLKEDLTSIQEHLNFEKKLETENLSIAVTQENLSNNFNLDNKIFLENYESWNINFEKWKNEKHIKLYELFHIVESCSKTVLNNSANAFLKYLFLHQNELFEKNTELKNCQSKIILFFKDSAQSLLFINYLTQYQEWFDEVIQRIIVCRTLILQNEENPVIQESPRLPSALANNRAEFYNLLTFYLEPQINIINFVII